MPEPTMVTLYCEPCPHCVFHAWQRIADGRLCWEAEWECVRCEFGAPDVCDLDHGWGRAPERVRAAIVAAEGTVLLRVDGSGGAALKVFRDALGMTIPEVLAAVREGYRATPVEAEYLTHLLGEAGFTVRFTASGPGGPG
ncbi:hypothetical protein [Streptomyces sp. NBC_00091]|uniref:hypothetical protein n=1 Tax=Streptomyces sp. NBC_00091 TaxID=2975648 RepID=UPI002258627E|nr:hypothetical protein [Streptomyces sp. NBC_00091]MCX5376167.1 hypothetical protein [Streptomyces sp. NBC_00091]